MKQLQLIVAHAMDQVPPSESCFEGNRTFGFLLSSSVKGDLEFAFGDALSVVTVAARRSIGFAERSSWEMPFTGCVNNDVQLRALEVSACYAALSIGS